MYYSLLKGSPHFWFNGASLSRFIHLTRYLVGQVVPGTRVTVTGIYTIFQNKTSYVRSLHLGVPS